ncbi:pirin family protein [Nocardioides pocheonensis]|uniref:pirin family protein n=1 Tax=Nocardioides pocheonensis TaxID=661485 RepID=UPI0016168F25|nr:pirin family protein [Nocardioides pocheonensis]
MTIDVRRAAERFRTESEGRTTWHSFSFGAHYDPGNVGFGALVAHNDELLPAGTGYPDHPHADVEIVTVVLEGALRHTDSDGRTGVLRPGEISRTSAGAGIVHAETTEPGVRTRFVQTWLRPDESGGPSSYAVAEVGLPTTLTEVVGPAGPLGVGTRGARLHLARAEPGELALPDAPRLHVFSATATATLGDRELVPGDAARLVDEGGRTLTVERPGLLLVWSQAR